MEEHDPEGDGGERDLSVEKVICGEASRRYVTTLHTCNLSRQFGETTEIKLVTAHSFVPAKVIRFQPERQREREMSETSLNVDYNVFFSSSPLVSFIVFLLLLQSEVSDVKHRIKITPPPLSNTFPTLPPRSAN